MATVGTRRQTLAVLAAVLAVAAGAGPRAGAQTRPADSPATKARKKSSGPRTAARKPPIQSELKVLRVLTDAHGDETLDETDTVAVGDVVEYNGIYRNVSTRRLLGVDFAIAVPHGMTYLPDSADPADSRILEADGKSPRRMVWHVERLDPGESVTLKLRVRVDPDATLTPPPPPRRRPEIRRQNQG